MATIERNLILLSLLSSCFHILLMIPYCSAADTLSQGQVLRDGEQLVSAKGAFTLGFFSPGSSKLRYLGIWCNIGDDWTVTKDVGMLSDRRYIWVANRDDPISDYQSGALVIDEFGILMISYARGNNVTSIPLSSIKTSGNSNTSAILLDSGNLVLRELDSDGSVKQVLWESFDHPTDTLVPGMKLGINFKTGHTWSLTSWRSYEVPGQGSYKIGGDPNGTRQLIIWWNGDIRWKSGPWQNDHFKFAHLYIPVKPSTEKFTFSYISNENETYFTFSQTKNTKISRFAMDLDGAITGSGLLADFGSCGYGVSQAPGCVEREMPDCRGLDPWFSPVLRRVVVDGGEHVSASQNWSVFDCQDRCFTDCSCAAFAYDETGCQIWRRGTRFEEVNESGREIYIYHFKKEKQKWWIWLVIASGVASLMLILGSLCCKRQRKLRAEGKAKTEQDVLLNEIGAYTTEANKSELEKNPNRDGKKNHELQFFSFATISSAANNFAFTNKLGQGGYGPVYKGKLENGQEVAIKRLSKSSGQGLQEFKNELALIARLQHTNLVRLVGCCIEREEKMLIYEFMPNKSLDFFLFDSTKKHLLDWKKRFSIIEGIAQGLLYLHKHSRLRIIHRDLKTSNILLDADMNPKISDFGTAKIFGQNESEANTKRVVGTRGYMSPEYIKDGTFSIKSDVFSFGVMLLEIVSGTKNTSFTLIEHTWELWRKDSCLEIVDPTLGDELCGRNEMLRCIHVGLLCVQESPEDRPDMADVISMLTNERMPLPAPKQPAFVFNTSVIATKTETYSSNMVSISEMEGM